MSDTDDSVAETLPEVSASQVALAEELKAKANALFQESHLSEAIDLYSQAIDANPRNHVLYANRAFAHIKMEAYGSAIIDASEAVSLDATYIKGYYRRGTAYLALSKLKQAKADFREAVKIEPNNKDARNKLKECENGIKKLKIELAADSNSVTASIDPDSITVEASYDGPRLGGHGEVTKEFCEQLTAHLKAEKRLHAKYAYQILLKVRNILAAEPTVVDVAVKEGEHFTVCGDVHGQYYDLCNIFEINGAPSETNPYLFNGDFVDRGSFGVETILLLFAYKAAYPDHLHLNRGNHETVRMNQMYGFEGEVATKYSSEMMGLFTEIFQLLPLAHVIGGKVIVLHGGLFSRDDTTLEELRKINRKMEPPDEGPMSELLWSDPGSLPGRHPSKRGIGVAFGQDVTEKFLQANGLELLIRSHECKDNGYEEDHGGKAITVFSAPNYCDQMGNKGAFIRFEEDMKPKFTTFAHVPHPAARGFMSMGGFDFSQFLR